MESLNFVIVKGDDYINEKEGLIINTTVQSVSSMNRVAEVVTSPKGTVLMKGDKVVVHHNIFRKRYSTNGNIVSSDFNIEGDLYFVPLTEVFMYKRDESWTPLDPYCFVEPIKDDNDKGLLMSLEMYSKHSHRGNIKNIGILRYPNKTLIGKGFKENDKILYSNNSEYEFEIDGRIYYKMSSRDVLAKFN